MIVAICGLLALITHDMTRAVRSNAIRSQYEEWFGLQSHGLSKRLVIRDSFNGVIEEVEDSDGDGENDVYHVYAPDVNGEEVFSYTAHIHEGTIAVTTGLGGYKGKAFLFQGDSASPSYAWIEMSPLGDNQRIARYFDLDLDTKIDASTIVEGEDVREAYAWVGPFLQEADGPPLNLDGHWQLQILKDGLSVEHVFKDGSWYRR
jgi:hypothetical protein